MLGVRVKAKQWGGRTLLLTSPMTAALATAGLFGAGAPAEAVPPPDRISFSVASLVPKFRPIIHDYVVRCDNEPVTVRVRTSGGWEAAVGDRPFRSGSFSQVVSLRTGRSFTITVRKAGSPELYRYYTRCLPNSFPEYTFNRSGPVNPEFFSVDRAFNPDPLRFAIIFDDHGVPIWWMRSPTWGTRVLPSGNLLWLDATFSPSRWAVHRLDGSLVRTFGAVGRAANAHDFQLMDNGNWLLGAYVEQSNVDTRAYGGSRNATVINAELQQVAPGGRLVWRWRSQDHISLAETGRFWSRVRRPEGYDIVHWNSIEDAGDSVIASFRHLDGVYKIRKSTGNIVWKLGGTRTPESLRVLNDPRDHTFGAQHDAGLLNDGTLIVFDNRTYLSDKRPRAVRFRIDEERGTATLLRAITDPQVTYSNCCGSARRLNSGDWLIYWGPTLGVGGYAPNGQRTFFMGFKSSYRAEPVPAGAVTAQDLRQGMKAMHGGS
jgi:hypothetical protein